MAQEVGPVHQAPQMELQGLAAVQINTSGDSVLRQVEESHSTLLPDGSWVLLSGRPT